MSDYCVGLFKEEVIKANNETEATQEFMKGLSDDDCYAIKLVDRETKWNFVSDKLPGNDMDKVLVCYEFKGKRLVDAADYWGNGDFVGYDEEGENYKKVIAWMPLPEIVKGE
jgi:hypothetical protein